jgi:hypothetical protein
MALDTSFHRYHQYLVYSLVQSAPAVLVWSGSSSLELLLELKVLTTNITMSS